MSERKQSGAFQIPDAAYEFSGLPRTLDPTNPNNLVAILTGIVVTIIFFVIESGAGADVAAAARVGLINGIGVAAAWGIAREVDPDHQASSLVAMGFAVILVAVIGTPAILMTVAAMLAARVLIQSTGIPLRLADAVVLAGVAGLAAALESAWLVGVALFGSVVTSALLTQRGRDALVLYGAAVLIAVATIGGIASQDAVEFTWGRDIVPIATALVALLAYAVILLRLPVIVESTADATGAVLSSNRLLATQAFLFCYGLAFLLYEGANGVQHVSPVYGVLLGIAAVNARYIVKPRPAPKKYL